MDVRTNLPLSWMGHWGAPSAKPSMAISSWCWAQSTHCRFILFFFGVFWAFIRIKNHHYITSPLISLLPWIRPGGWVLGLVVWRRLWPKKNGPASVQKVWWSRKRMLVVPWKCQGPRWEFCHLNFFNKVPSLITRFHGAFLRSGGPKLKSTQVYTKKYAAALLRFHSKYMVQTLPNSCPKFWI